MVFFKWQEKHTLNGLLRNQTGYKILFSIWFYFLPLKVKNEIEKETLGALSFFVRHGMKKIVVS